MRLGPVLCRGVTAADAPALAQLADQLGYPVSALEVLGRLERLLERQRHGDRERVIVAEGPQALVLGWTSCRLCEPPHEPAHVEIAGFVVDRSARRQGVGRALMEAVAVWGREQGVRSIHLGANVIREDAHGFYAALGFREVKRQVRFTRAIDPAP